MKSHENINIEEESKKGDLRWNRTKSFRLGNSVAKGILSCSYTNYTISKAMSSSEDIELRPSFPVPDLENPAKKKLNSSGSYLVIGGCFATAAVLFGGLLSFRRGNSKNSQMFMRARVLTQGATLLAVAGTFWNAANLKGKERERAEAAGEGELGVETLDEEKARTLLEKTGRQRNIRENV